MRGRLSPLVWMKKRSVLMMKLLCATVFVGKRTWVVGKPRWECLLLETMGGVPVIWVQGLLVISGGLFRWLEARVVRSFGRLRPRFLLLAIMRGVKVLLRSGLDKVMSKSSTRGRIFFTCWALLA